MIDILDKLQGADSHVRLLMKSGEIIWGKPDCIVYDEDENGQDTLKRLRFESWDSIHAKYFSVDDIASFDPVKEEDIPPYE